MRRLRVLVLMHEDLVPPDPLNGHDPSKRRVEDGIRCGVHPAEAGT